MPSTSFLNDGFGSLLASVRNVPVFPVMMPVGFPRKAYTARTFRSPSGALVERLKADPTLGLIHLSNDRRFGRARRRKGRGVREHVTAIRRYTCLRELGFPPAAIKLLLEGQQGVPFPVAPGITLVIDPDLLGSGADTGPLIGRIRTLLDDQLQKDTSHEHDCSAAEKD
jgi:hypothetical protein